MIDWMFWSIRHGCRRVRLLVALVGCMGGQVLLELLKPWPMVLLVDFILQQKPLPDWLNNLVSQLPGGGGAGALITWCVLATLVIFLLHWTVGLGHAYLKVSLGQRMVYDLAADILTRLQQLSLRFHTGSRVGDNLRRVSEDAACLSTILLEAVVPVSMAAATLATMFGILWQIDARLTLLALVVVPFMALVFARYAVPMMNQSYAQQEAEARIYEEVDQTFSSMPLVQASVAESVQDERFVRATDGALAATVRLAQTQLNFKFWMGLATAMGTALILWMGTHHALAGTLSIGMIILFLSYLASLYGPIETIMYTSSTVQGAAGSARRVWEVLSSEPDVRDKPGARPLGPVRGRIEFDHVTFGYEPGRTVLDDIHLVIEPGETIALVGPTGVGKSTVASLLPRYYDPDKGEVRIDGRNIASVQLQSLREQIALVLQEPFLFPMTIAENIAYGRPEATMEELVAAAKAARADGFIQRLPRGYHTVIGERGATLSGGERQRLSIARALLKKAPILILDEPTSALDVETERDLMQALQALMQHQTTLLIAHRLSTVRHADRILMMQEGRIVESGTHEELMTARGTYFNWCRLQGLEEARS